MISERLRKLREEKGISKRKISEDLQMPYNTYCSYEYGTREPGLDSIVRIAEYYGVTTDELLGINKETPEDVPIENVYQFLLESGFVSEGEDLSEDDLAFLTSIIAALRDWFIRNKNT